METRENNIVHLLSNPFTRIAGLPALVFGALMMLAGALLAGFFNARFDGVVDLHFGGQAGFIAPLADQLTVWACLVICFYPLSLLLGARPRFIDIAGTMALSRFPFALAPLVNAGGNISRITAQLKNIDPQNFKLNVSGMDMAVLVLLSLITVALLVWLIALYYNAFKVCTNLKGNRLVFSFIIGLVLAETLSLYLIRNVFHG